MTTKYRYILRQKGVNPMAWSEAWERWRQDNAAELKLLRELIIKMRGEGDQGERPAKNAGEVRRGAGAA